jgi:hypothetical protein
VRGGHAAVLIADTGQPEGGRPQHQRLIIIALAPHVASIVDRRRDLRSKLCIQQRSHDLSCGRGRQLRWSDQVIVTRRRCGQQRPCRLGKLLRFLGHGELLEASPIIGGCYQAQPC